MSARGECRVEVCSADPGACGTESCGAGAGHADPEELLRLLAEVRAVREAAAFAAGQTEFSGAGEGGTVDELVEDWKAGAVAHITYSEAASRERLRTRLAAEPARGD